MKHFLFTAFVFLFYHGAFGQADSAACLDYKKGYFSYTDSLGNTVIVHRRNNYQYEKNTVTKVRTQFRVAWKSPCSYQLTQANTNSKAARKYRNRNTLVVVDKSDGDMGYTYGCGCSDGSQMKRGYMKKITKDQYYHLL